MLNFRGLVTIDPGDTTSWSPSVQVGDMFHGGTVRVTVCKKPRLMSLAWLSAKPCHLAHCSEQRRDLRSCPFASSRMYSVAAVGVVNLSYQVPDSTARTNLACVVDGCPLSITGCNDLVLRVRGFGCTM